MHKHDGKDGSGLISHTVLTDVGEDDHHAKNHRHGQDGVDLVHLETDVIGTLPVTSLPYVWLTGIPDTSQLYRNPLQDDKVVRISSTESQIFLYYDWQNEGRLSSVLTYYDDKATEETLIYEPYTDSRGVIKDILSRVEKVVFDAQVGDVAAAITKVMGPKY